MNKLLSLVLLFTLQSFGRAVPSVHLREIST